MTKRDAIEHIRSLLRAQRDPTRPLAERLKLPGLVTLHVDRDRDAQALLREVKPLMQSVRRAMRPYTPPGWFSPTPEPSTAGFYANATAMYADAGEGCPGDPASYQIGSAGSVSVHGGLNAMAQPPSADDPALWFTWDPPDEGNAFIWTSVFVTGSAVLGVGSSQGGAGGIGTTNGSLTFKLALSVDAYQIDPSSGAVNRATSSISPIDIDLPDQYQLQMVAVNQTFDLYSAPAVIGVEPTSPLIIRLGATLSWTLDEASVSWDFCPGFTFSGVSINFIPWRDIPPPG